QPVEGVPQARRLRQLLGAGGGHPIGREPRLEVLGSARGPPHLADAEGEEKNSSEGDQTEYRGGGGHLCLQKGQYSLSGDGCLTGVKSVSGTSSPSAFRCSMRIGKMPIAV